MHDALPDSHRRNPAAATHSRRTCGRRRRSTPARRLGIHGDSMYAAGPLDFIPIPFVFLITIAFVLLFLELGFRLGRRRAASVEVEQASSVGAMANASLVLL